MKEIKKVRFRDSSGLATIPQNTSDTYVQDMQDAQLKDNTLNLYNAKNEKEKKEMIVQLEGIGQSLDYYLPSDYLTENDVVVSFDSNIQRLQATTRAKASRSGWVSKALQHFPKEAQAVAEAIAVLQSVADKSSHFITEWVDTETNETETETTNMQQTYSGVVQFALVGKRSKTHSKKVGNSQITRVSKS